ncbi:Protein bric-a-brac 1 [Lucilia cuprina]|nr:Protein bric-a-brac 1 [Lucilia cuprina]
MCLALKIRKQFAHQAFGNFPPEDFHSPSPQRAPSPPVSTQHHNMGGPPAPTSSNNPPEGQTYCLRWNNHKSNLVEILDALIKVESYVDCTIVVDDQVQFKAHRVVLAANSPYFQSILQDLPMDHCSIIFPGVKAFEMRALLEYMYTGEVNVTQSQIPKIMRIAEELEVKGLFDMADLKEKFNKLSEEHAERSASNPYASTSAPSNPYSSVTTTSSPTAGLTHNKPCAKDSDNYRHNSSSVISTSTNISPSAAPSSSSSPPYSSYKSPYTSLYNKSPAPSANPSSASASAQPQSTQQTASNLTPTSERSSAQWPLSPSAAAAAAMLSSVYESAPDMNPLKRKKLSSMSSMLMNRDTPILRNVLAQANPADSSQQLPLLLPNAGNKGDKSSGSADKNNHSFNGSDYSDKKYHDEPHSPFTDRSFEDDGFDPKGSNFGGNFAANGNQKPEWKRYKQYTRSDIMSAIQCVREGMSALQASRKFGVPSRTLYDKVKKLGITTGRPMNRTMKRSPSSVESSAAFPYAHGYGQASAAAAAMHDAAIREERELKEHHRNSEHHHLAPTIPHPAAALLDHAFLQQALENRGGGDIAGREALHAMALAAAAHAAANRMSTSPGPNGNAVRSPSPSNFALKYNNMRNAEQELMERHELEREREREREFAERERERDQDLERERNDEEEDDHVEDLSVARKENSCSPLEQRERPESPYSPGVTNSADNDKTVIMTTKLPSNASSSDEAFITESNLKREVVIDDVRAD